MDKKKALLSAAVAGLIAAGSLAKQITVFADDSDNQEATQVQHEHSKIQQADKHIEMENESGDHKEKAECSSANGCGQKSD